MQIIIGQPSTCKGQLLRCVVGGQSDESTASNREKRGAESITMRRHVQGAHYRAVRQWGRHSDTVSTAPRSADTLCRFSRQLFPLVVLLLLLLLPLFEISELASSLSHTHTGIELLVALCRRSIGLYCPWAVDSASSCPARRKVSRLWPLRKTALLWMWAAMRATLAEISWLFGYWDFATIMDTWWCSVLPTIFSTTRLSILRWQHYSFLILTFFFKSSIFWAASFDALIYLADVCFVVWVCNWVKLCPLSRLALSTATISIHTNI